MLSSMKQFINDLPYTVPDFINNYQEELLWIYYMLDKTFRYFVNTEIKHQYENLRYVEENKFQ